MSLPPREKPEGNSLAVQKYTTGRDYLSDYIPAGFRKAHLDKALNP